MGVLSRWNGVRLKPRTVFLGIIAFGLPIALTTGWTLAQGGDPADPAAPGGTGFLGNAPQVSTPAVPSPLQSPVAEPPLRQVAGRPRPSAPVSGPAERPRPVPMTSAPRPSASFSPPPVPTPTSLSPAPTEEPPESPPPAGPSPNP